MKKDRRMAFINGFIFVAGFTCLVTAIIILLVGVLTLISVGSGLL